MIMTQEFVSLLLGLGCLIGSGIIFKRSKQSNNLPPAISDVLFVFGVCLLLFATIGFITSLPSIKQVNS